MAELFASAAGRAAGGVVGGDSLCEEFQGYLAVQVGVVGQVDGAHSSFAESSQDFVLRDGLADHGWFGGLPPRGVILA